ncbi:MAG: hypothetical protein AAF675_06800 [Pseudomonadota bacterium]
MFARISLFAAGIVTLVLLATVGRVFFQELFGGPASTLARVEAVTAAVEEDIKASVPVQVNEITRLVGADAVGRDFYFFYTVDASRNDIAFEAVQAAVLGNVETAICGDAELAWLSKHGTTFIYSYIDNSNEPFAEVPVPPDQCGDVPPPPEREG